MNKEELKTRLRRKTHDKLHDRDRSAGRAAAEPSLHTPSVDDIEQEIRLRAYEIFAARAGAGGTAEEDWYQAESEVLSRYTDAGSSRSLSLMRSLSGAPQR